MKSLARSLIISVVSGCLFYFGFAHPEVDRMRPIHFDSATLLEEELYAFTNQHDRLPERSELSDFAQNIIIEVNGISYSKLDGMNFRYDKSYPSNIPLIGIFSGGWILDNAQMCIGYNLSPDHIKNNAALRKSD